MVSNTVVVGIGEIEVLKTAGQLTCAGLGSCVGIVAYDPVAFVGGMAHVMLPTCPKSKAYDKPGRFADLAIAELIACMERAGATRENLRVAIAGGAQVFRFGDPSHNRLDIGARNGQAVAEQLEKHGLHPLVADLGGNLGRTLVYTLESGVVTVRTVTQPEKTLCNMREK